MCKLKLNEIGEDILCPNVSSAQMKPSLVRRDTTIGHSTPSAGEESTLCRFWHGRREQISMELIDRIEASKPACRVLVVVGRTVVHRGDPSKARQTAPFGAALLACFWRTVFAVKNHSTHRVEYLFIGLHVDPLTAWRRVAAAVIVNREQQSIVIERDIIAYHVSHRIVDCCGFVQQR